MNTSLPELTRPISLPNLPLTAERIMAHSDRLQDKADAVFLGSSTITQAEYDAWSRSLSVHERNLLREVTK